MEWIVKMHLGDLMLMIRDYPAQGLPTEYIPVKKISSEFGHFLVNEKLAHDLLGEFD